MNCSACNCRYRQGRSVNNHRWQRVIFCYFIPITFTDNPLLQLTDIKLLDTDHLRFCHTDFCCLQHCNVQKITKKAASRRGPGSHSPIGRTVPPEEYTEYHENVLQSYRYKQLNARSHCYFLVVITYRGALPVEAIRRHRMQDNPSALPRTPLGCLQCTQAPPSRQRGAGCPSSRTSPLQASSFGPSGLASLVPSLQN